MLDKEKLDAIKEIVNNPKYCGRLGYKGGFLKIKEILIDERARMKTMPKPSRNDKNWRINNVRIK